MTSSCMICGATTTTTQRNNAAAPLDATTTTTQRNNVAALLKCPNEGCVNVFCSQIHLNSHLAFLNDGRKLCLPFKIANSPQFGRHFIATRDIKPLELILLEPPAVVGPATKTKPLCLNCLQPAAKSTRCVSCHFPSCEDCSKKGSKKNVLLHDEGECAALSKTNHGLSIVDWHQDQLIYASLFVYRSLRLRDKDPEAYHHLRHFLMPGDTSDLEAFAFVDQVVEALEDIFDQKVSKKDVINTMGVKRTNANDLALIDLDGGVALYPTYPLMNSHCYCNTTLSIDKKTLEIEVRAQRPISEGEEITTRYYTPWEGQPVRQEMIWNSWKFLCQCTRCQSRSDLDTNFSGVKCTSCDRGVLLPSDMTVIKPSWHCDQCQFRTDQASIERVLLELKNLESDPADDGISLRKRISNRVKRLEVSLHPNHYMIFKLKDRYIKTNRSLAESNGNSSETQLMDELKTQVKYSQDVLDIVQVLDPGFTLRSAGLLKTLATSRMELSKLKLVHDQTYTKAEHIKEIRTAMHALKIVSFSFNHPEKAVA